jgi:hypothetical protein
MLLTRLPTFLNAKRSLDSPLPEEFSLYLDRQLWAALISEENHQKQTITYKTTASASFYLHESPRPQFDIRISSDQQKRQTDIDVQFRLISAINAMTQKPAPA